MTDTGPGGPHKLLCTGRASHRPRTIGKFGLIAEGGFSIQVRSPDNDAGIWDIYMPPMLASESSVHLRCPTCGRDMRFKSAEFERFLREDTGSKRRDVSLFAAIL